MGLAGVKRKQRISVDPQNKTWKDDTEKFGYRMLTKMGWQEGKGLGKNEDGTTDNLNVAFKADTIGLGVTKKDMATETYYQLSVFENILRQAQPDDDGEAQDGPTGVVKEDATTTEDRNGDKREKKKGKEGKENGKVTKKTKKRSAANADDANDADERLPHKHDPAQAEPRIAGRLAHRAKWIKNKRVDQYSAAHLKEILGTHVV